MHGCGNSILCDRKIVYRKIFLRTKFCLTFFAFGRDISKLFAYNFQQVCHKRNLRLSGNFFEEKFLILTIWIFHTIFRFLGETFFRLLEEKTRQGCQNYILKSGEKFWAEVIFEKSKNFKLFRNHTKKCWDFGWNFQGTVVKIAFYRSGKNFLMDLKNFVKVIFQTVSRRLAKCFWIVLQILRQVCQNCLVTVRRMISIRSLFGENCVC